MEKMEIKISSVQLRGRSHCSSMSRLTTQHQQDNSTLWTLGRRRRHTWNFQVTTFALQIHSIHQTHTKYCPLSTTVKNLLTHP